MTGGAPGAILKPGGNPGFALSAAALLAAIGAGWLAASIHPDAYGTIAASAAFLALIFAVAGRHDLSRPHVIMPTFWYATVAISQLHILSYQTPWSAQTVRVVFLAPLAFSAASFAASGNAQRKPVRLDLDLSRLRVAASVLLVLSIGGTIWKSHITGGIALTSSNIDSLRSAGGIRVPSYVTFLTDCSYLSAWLWLLRFGLQPKGRRWLDGILVAAAFVIAAASASRSVLFLAIFTPVAFAYTIGLLRGVKVRHVMALVAVVLVVLSGLFFVRLGQHKASQSPFGTYLYRVLVPATPVQYRPLLPLYVSLASPFETLNRVISEPQVAALDHHGPYSFPGLPPALSPWGAPGAFYTATAALSAPYYFNVATYVGAPFADGGLELALLVSLLLGGLFGAVRKYALGRGSAAGVAVAAYGTYLAGFLIYEDVLAVYLRAVLWDLLLLVVALKWCRISPRVPVETPVGRRPNAFSLHRFRPAATVKGRSPAPWVSDRPVSSATSATRSPERSGRIAAPWRSAAALRFRQRLRGDTARFAPGRVVPAALMVGATPVFARVLGPSDYGLLAVATTTTLLASTVLFGWSDIVAVRELVDGHSSVEELCSQASLIFILALGAGAAVTAAAFVAGSNFELVAAISLATAGWGAVTFATGAMRGKGDASGYVKAASVGSSGRAILGVPAALIGGGAAGVVFGWAAACALAVVLAARRLRIDFHQVRVRLPSREFVAYAGPAVGVASGFLFLALADRVILAGFRGSADVGTYSLGYSLVDQSLVLCFSVLQAAGFPRLLRALTTGGAALGSTHIAIAIRRALTFSGIIALPLLLFGEQILTLVGGAAYSKDDAGFMQLVVVGVVFLGLGQYLSIPLQHARRSGRWAQTVIACAVANLLLNLVLIPTAGLLGAGAATAGAYGLFFALSLRAVADTTPSLLRQIDGRPFLMGIAVGAGVGIACLEIGLWEAGCVLAPLAYTVVALRLPSRLRVSNAR